MDGSARRRTALLTLVGSIAVLGCNEGAKEARDLAAACEADDAVACNELGHRLARGDQVLLDWRRASEVYMEACETGEPEGCVRLGMMRVHEDARVWGLRPDSAVATELLRRGCDEGAPMGCTYLADMYMEPDSVEPDVEPTGVLQDVVRAAELYGRACDEGAAVGCTKLGLLVETGTGIEADSVRAAQLHQRACDAGSELGCAHLGRSFEHGLGVPQDVNRAATLYEEACGTDKTGCLYLGALHESGIGVEVDYDRALELYNEACYSRRRRFEGSPPIAEACFRAGEILADGRVESRDSFAAIRQFRRACRLGYEEACARV